MSTPPVFDRPLFRHDVVWREDGRGYARRTRDQLVGYDAQLDAVEGDILRYQTHSTFLESIGEGSSLNYLLHGPPGVGKSSFVLTLANELQLPLFVADASCLLTANVHNLQKLLSPDPPRSHGRPIKTVLVLFEDFDRFLSRPDLDMAAVLNALDGVDDRTGIVRIFTANDWQVLNRTPALMNRLSACIPFHMPVFAEFAAKLDAMVAGWARVAKEPPVPSSRATRERFLAKAVQLGLTMRPFCAHVKRHLFGDDPVGRMLADFEQLESMKKSYTPRRWWTLSA